MIRDPLNALIPHLKTGGRRVAMPANLDDVTTINHDRECRPADVGLDQAAIDKIWEAVTAYYRTGLHPALTLVIRRHGKIVMSRGIGKAHVGASGESLADHHLLADADTPICLFSGSKAVSAMLIHKLSEEGKLNLDDPVMKHLPAYAANSKHRTTIRQLLTHRAGIRAMPIEDVTPELMFDFDAVVKILCDYPPIDRPGRDQAYHATTAGYILGAVAMAASGETLPGLLKRIIADPLGCEHMTFGMPEDRRHEVALSLSTGPKRVPIVSDMIAHLLGGVEEGEVTAAINSADGLSAVIPAANIYATAEEACRFYQMLLDGGRWNGRQVFKPETIAAAIKPGKLMLDRSMNAPVRYTPGFMHGEKLWSLFGFNTPKAFGHLGFINILCWADPERDMSVAFLNTGKSLAPEGFLGFGNVSRMISQVIPRDGR
ncbi:CubicO group peptidase (beta-lactamase class C family) [Fluviicoccus keumensis]|uniref:CubicO group peptidase (Beta-lactamase class C family) n=1 Tax=Fluviicoccus keumensis TaxID=1435465 RepID=A0A4Q7YHK2_9GAMM|nr:serine hydrolase domain-containing protein [Fluviicoccus keumensis]RZU36887.1 CubicO group peptidase (beta-lactamase class C family) [Fluviicoccus keumensis]